MLVEEGKSVERMPVSETVQELIAYVTENLKVSNF